jgi:hypothetical protein
MFDQVFPPFVRFPRIDARAPERRAEIQEVVANHVPAVLLDHRIEGVDRLGIDMVQPGGERA